jgi:hypothetical protein
MSYFVLQPLPHPSRQRACDAVMAAPDDHTVRISEPKKSRDQEEKYHAIIGDIHKSKMFYFLGRNDWSMEDIKRLLVESFAHEMELLGTPLSQVGKVVPSLDMKRTVQLGIQTRRLEKKEACELIEYLYSYGSSIGIEFDARPLADGA